MDISPLVLPETTQWNPEKLVFCQCREFHTRSLGHIEWQWLIIWPFTTHSIQCCQILKYVKNASQDVNPTRGMTVSLHPMTGSRPFHPLLDLLHGYSYNPLRFGSVTSLFLEYILSSPLFFLCALCTLKRGSVINHQWN